MQKKRIVVVFAISAVLSLALIAAFTIPGFGRGGEFTRAEFVVGNLSCGGCISNIRQELERIPGVGHVEVNLATGRASVEYDPAEVQPESIARAITAAGYPAVPASRSMPTEAGSRAQVNNTQARGSGCGGSCCR